MINHGNISQGLPSTIRKKLLSDQEPKAVQPQRWGGEVGVVAAATTSNVTDDLQKRMTVTKTPLRKVLQSSPFWIFGVPKFVTAV